MAGRYPLSAMGGSASGGNHKDVRRVGTGALNGNYKNKIIIKTFKK